MNCEKRFRATELRANGRRLEGYAAVFNSQANLPNGLIETISPGAFTRSLTVNPDILALVDHDPSKVLARTSSKTLRLSEDRQGLAFELDLPDTQLARDVLALSERGDLGGMSFGFVARDDEYRGETRILNDVDLYEISVVSAWPAYSDTSVAARGLVTKPRLASAQRTLKILEILQ